jgi:geranylgeranylglycerol-phosphate geranylgeranyltransferase
MKASSVSAYLELARWQNCLIAAAGVVVGAWWAGGANSGHVALMAVTAILFGAAANAWNDYDDAEIDAVAHPSRPIPSGRLTRREAVTFAVRSVFLAQLLPAFVSLWLFVVSMVVGNTIMYYGFAFKRTGLPGNLTVAILASLPFLYGAWAAGNPRAGLVLVAIAAPLHFAREIAKDIDDAPGDLGHRRTVPIRWGLKTANALILVALVAFAVQIVPIARAWPRFAIGIVPALALLVYAASRSFRGAPGAPRAFKAAMICAMAALVIARP